MSMLYYKVNQRVIHTDTCKSVSRPNSRLQSCFSLPTASPAGSFLSVGGLVQLPLATLISVTFVVIIRSTAG
jgi:hypothetical protein